MDVSSNSAVFNFVTQNWLYDIIAVAALIASAFLGGFFSGIWNYYFESKRTINEKRRDKYYDHRNTIVQIEHEMLPFRVNMSRNLAAVDDAIKNTHVSNVRFILKFDKLYFSPGLSLKILNTELINKYVTLYSEIDKLNSDYTYLSGLVASIREDQKVRIIDDTKIEQYKTYLPFLKEECEDIDQKSLELLALCQVALSNDERELREKYIKDGEQIIYKINKKSFTQKYKKIQDEEDWTKHPNEKRSKMVLPYLDLRNSPI